MVGQAHLRGNPGTLVRGPGTRDGLRVGIVGCGDISAKYLSCLRALRGVEVVAISARNETAAAEVATAHGLTALATSALLANPDIDLVVNLSTPLSHHAITLAALRAGKHVYSEKPLAASRLQALELLQAAEEQGVLLACAPAPILGPAQQAAREVIDAGGLGPLLGATGAMMYPGPELFHANPAPLYQPAAGPLFDMGVYHIAALVNLLGPVAQVAALGTRARGARSVLVGPKAGAAIAVQVPTHVSVLIGFASGAQATLNLSFDALSTRQPALEIHGMAGTLELPQPSQFTGAVSLSSKFRVWQPLATWQDEWQEAYWAIGIADLVHAIGTGHSPRLSGEFGFHCLDVLVAITEAMDGAGMVDVTSTCLRPAPLRQGDPLFALFHPSQTNAPADSTIPFLLAQTIERASS